MIKKMMCLGMLVATMSSVASARDDVLEKRVTLKTEADLVQAVLVTMQHAMTVSEQYRGRDQRLKDFARREVTARRQSIAELSKLTGAPPVTGAPRGAAQKDDQAYLQAMLRNHARQLELFEYGAGLALSKDVKRFMGSLNRAAASEFNALSEMDDS